MDFALQCARLLKVLLHQALVLSHFGNTDCVEWGADSAKRRLSLQNLALSFLRQNLIESKKIQEQSLVKNILKSKNFFIFAWLFDRILKLSFESAFAPAGVPLSYCACRIYEACGSVEVALSTKG